MKDLRRPCIAVIALALWLGSGSVAEAQKPIRIGASMSQSGSLAAPGQNMLRGYRLCIKHANDKGGVLARLYHPRGAKEPLGRSWCGGAA